MANMTVSYKRDGDVHTYDLGPGSLSQIVIDNSNVPAEARGGTAKQLLGASVLACYTAALAGALDARGAKYSDLTAKAILTVGGNELGQGRVKKIDIEARVTLSEEDQEIFERCAKIMKQGCLVTGSLHDGIEIGYDLQPEYTD